MSQPVLFIRSDVKLAGPGRLMLSSALALRSVGIDVIFVSSGGALVPEIKKNGFKHETLPALAVGQRSVSGMLRTAWQLQKIVRRHKVSVIHSFNAQAGLMAVPARIIGRTRQFNTVLGNGREKILRFMPFKLIAVSKSVSEKLKEFGVPASKIKIIYNSTLDDRYLITDRAEFDKMQERRASLSPFNLISVAIATGQKGHAEILDALAAYLRRDDATDIRVTFVGDGPKLASIENYAADLGLTDHVAFVGASYQVAEYLDQAHCFIHLAEMETFGIVVAEANARGLPVIAANVGGIPEVLVDQQTGLLVNRSNPAEVAEAISTFVKDNEKMIQFGWAGAQRAARMFSQAKMADDLIETYTKPWRPN
jgi:glycosyltransferase involved in cell wall biosynthesis